MLLFFGLTVNPGVCEIRPIFSLKKRYQQTVRLGSGFK